ncbi:MAG: mitochondrial fission ELM1 family protein [Reyranellaceae bacterium]
MPSTSPDSPAASAADTRPLVWVLTGAKAGDNAQIGALAEATGLRVKTIPLAFNWRYRVPNVFLGATLGTLTPPARQRLAPPWPDLVISAGRRSVPAARWIGARCGARLVHVGRPWGLLRWFDLVIAMPQYRVSPRANVLQARMPFNSAPAARLDRARAQWREAFAAWPRPYLAVLLGGSMRPLSLDAGTAASIARWASDWARTRGGSVLALTSPRTDAEAADAFFAALEAPGLRHRWRAGEQDNPYLGVLALADEFVVTGDSASMLAEAVRRGKPVHIARLPLRLRGKRWRAALAQRLLPEPAFRKLAEWSLVTPNRDLQLLHERLIGEGLAVYLGDPAPPPRPFQEDMEQAVARIRALLPPARR